MGLKKRPSVEVELDISGGSYERDVEVKLSERLQARSALSEGFDERIRLTSCSKCN